MRRSLFTGSLVLALAAGGCGGDAREPGSSPAPSVEIADLTGLDQALAARRGNACLLNFWATWCPPCVAELPDLVDVVRENEARGARVLGVSFDLMIPDVEREEGLELVRGFLAERDLALPTVVFDDADYEAINERFDLPGSIPVTLAFDREGRLVDRHEGEADRARFAEMMRKALGN